MVTNVNFQCFRIQISFERSRNQWLFSFSTQHINTGSSRVLNIGAGGIKQCIADENFSGSAGNGKQYFLRSPALMCRNHILHSGDLLYRFFKVIETLTAGIGFIPYHHPGPLRTAHGTGTAISE